MIDNIEALFGKMNVTRGKERVCDRMKRSLRDERTVAVRMREYVEESISEVGEQMNESAASPAKHTLFNTRGKSKPLGKARG